MQETSGKLDYAALATLKINISFRDRDGKLLLSKAIGGGVSVAEATKMVKEADDADAEVDDMEEADVRELAKQLLREKKARTRRRRPSAGRRRRRRRAGGEAAAHVSGGARRPPAARCAAAAPSRSTRRWQRLG